jgi:hypothetical protein
MKLKDVNESIELLKDSNLIKEDLGIEQTFNNLLILKKKLSKELYEIKENIAKTRKSLIK